MTIGPPRPLPQPSELTKPHWDACAEQKLLFQRCGSCGVAVFPPQEFCPKELTETLEWQESTGLGVVYSYTVIWRPQTPAFEVPYIVADVLLGEGFHLLTNLVDCDLEAVAIDMPVEVSFRTVNDAMTLPFFRPVSTGP